MIVQLKIIKNNLLFSQKFSIHISKHNFHEKVVIEIKIFKKLSLVLHLYNTYEQI